MRLSLFHSQAAHSKPPAWHIDGNAIAWCCTRNKNNKRKILASLKKWICVWCVTNFNLMQMQVNVYEECSDFDCNFLDRDGMECFICFLFIFLLVRLQCLFPENKLSSIGNKWNYLATLAEAFSCFHKHHISILNIRFNYLLWRSFLQSRVKYGMSGSNPILFGLSHSCARSLAVHAVLWVPVH